MNAAKITLLSLMAASTLAATQAQAETVTEYIKKQGELETLDHTIERYERMIKVKEAQFELDNVGTEKASSGGGSSAQPSNQQIQYFGPNGQPIQAGQGAPDAMMQERQRQTEEERQREQAQSARRSEMAIAQNAKMVEVFRLNTPGETYGAVLDINGGLTEVKTGDTVSNWKITRISLTEITLENQQYPGAVRVIKNIR